MLKEGYTLPFQSRPSLTRSPKLSNAMHNFTGTYIGEKHYISLWTRNGAVEPVQNLWASSALLGSKTNWGPILGLSKPNLSETIRTTLQQREWVTSIDFKNAYFHIPIQEQSRTYQMSCPGSDIPVQSTVFRSVHCTHGAHCSSKEMKLMAIERV